MHSPGPVSSLHTILKRLYWIESDSGCPSSLRRGLSTSRDACQTGTHLVGLRTVRTLPEVHLILRSGILQLMLVLEGAPGNIMGHGIALMRKVVGLERTMQRTVVIAGP